MPSASFLSASMRARNFSKYSCCSFVRLRERERADRSEFGRRCFLWLMEISEGGIGIEGVKRKERTGRPSGPQPTAWHCAEHSDPRTCGREPEWGERREERVKM